MILLCLIIGVIFSIRLIKLNKWAGIGILLFCLLELLFRDFGLFGFPTINALVSKLIFLLATVILCLSIRRLIGEDEK